MSTTLQQPQRPRERAADRPARAQPAILRIGPMQQYTGLSRSSIYRKMADDPSFPLPIKLGPRSMGWFVESVDQWLAKQPPARRARLASRQAGL